MEIDRTVLPAVAHATARLEVEALTHQWIEGRAIGHVPIVTARCHLVQPMNRLASVADGLRVPIEVAPRSALTPSSIAWTRTAMDR